MMKVREMSRALGMGASVGLALIAACAGSDPPELTAAQADAIQAAYEGSAGGVGGGAGGGAGVPSAAGAGGGTQVASSPGGSGGATAGVAGSGGGSGSAAAGAAGTTSSGSTCDGFAILAANCATSGCHGQGSNIEAFAASEEAARSFIGAPGTLACGGQGLVIDTDDPAESLMVRKLAEDAPCGQRMPPFGEALSAADAECIEDWISGL